MNKTELINAVATRTGVSKKDTREVMEATMDEIVKAMQNRDTVQLIGFGTFKSAFRNATTATNPKTKEKVNVPAKNVPKLVFSKSVKEAVR